MAVFVLDKHKKPIMPCSEKRARHLLERGRARVHKIQPFTIRLVDRTLEESELQPVRIKIDPGRKTTGIAVVREEQTDVEDPKAHLLFAGELHHRGTVIKKKMDQRRAYRRRRRSNLRYRKPRFGNRRRTEGWLPPSLKHRVDSTVSIVGKLRRLTPVSGIAMELVRFDLQQMEKPEIAGVEYQQGTLAGYEVREYLLEKWGRTCIYCGAKGVPLEIDHIHPKSKGGSDRVSNLTLACRSCNERKGNQEVSVFLKKKPEVLDRILTFSKRPLRDATVVNATRWALFNRLKEPGIPVEIGSGGRTKWNRTRLRLPKTHAIDAACVGMVGDVVRTETPVLTILAMGRGSHQRTRTTAFGFPRGVLPRTKTVHGFQTGDLVRAVVPSGKKAGTHVGRVAVRTSGSFNVQTGAVVVQGISHRYCHRLQRADGYGYYCGKEMAHSSPRLKPGVSCAEI